MIRKNRCIINRPRQACQRIFNERKAKRLARGDKLESLCVSPTEPEAMLQRLKKGRYAPSYKPSVLANEQRLVIAHAVDPSNEVCVIKSLLDQAQRVNDELIKELLLDAGYFDNEVIRQSDERGIVLYCPEGVQAAKKIRKGVFYKSQFHYDPLNDEYRCPANEVLCFLRQNTKNRPYRIYAGKSCPDCLLKEQCTRSKSGLRLIKRYPEDTDREILRRRMSKPEAQKIFNQRKAYVEPVFSALRGRQNLSRFLRRGLSRVKLEFALHVMAYNLAKAVALLWFSYGIAQIYNLFYIKKRFRFSYF